MIIMAKLVWAFDMEPDSQDVDDNISMGYVDGFTTQPNRKNFLFNPSKGP